KGELLRSDNYLVLRRATWGGEPFSERTQPGATATNWPSLPAVDPLRSGVSTHAPSACGRPEGSQAHVVRSCASRKMEFARPSRSGRFWGRGDRRTWRSSL